MQNLPWQIIKIIETANELLHDGKTGSSTSEQIAAAFVLNRKDLLPYGYQDIVEAWDRLNGWQGYVRQIKYDYMHLIDGAG